ncbi:MAG: hypothetical protein NVSMB67_25370 [Flavisolibacter sp.]
MFWVNYSEKLYFSSSWNIAAEFESRMGSNFQLAQLQSRIMVARKLNEQSTVGLGFSYILNRPIPYLRANPSHFSPGFTLHQQFDFNHRIKRITISHRIKPEERWIQKKSQTGSASAYAFSVRGWYRLQFSYPLGWNSMDEKGLTLKAYDEILLNVFIRNNSSFDQNRYYVGINYSLSKKFALELGFVNIIQQLNNFEKLQSTNFLRLSVYHNLNLFH